jgi:hypothetical protein
MGLADMACLMQKHQEAHKVVPQSAERTDDPPACHGYPSCHLFWERTHAEQAGSQLFATVSQPFEAVPQPVAAVCLLLAAFADQQAGLTAQDGVAERWGADVVAGHRLYLLKACHC